MKIVLILAFVSIALAQNTQVPGDRNFTGQMNMSGSTLQKNRQGASLPATCVVGESFLLTFSVPFVAEYCTATNTWEPAGSVLPNTPTQCSGSSPVASGIQVNGNANCLALTSSAIAAQLPRFRLALSKTRGGVKDTKILFVGDSTTRGYESILGSTFPTYGAYPSRVQLIKTPYAQGLAIIGEVDSRWALGTGWSYLQGFGFCIGGPNTSGVVTATAPSGHVVFTPGATQGTFDSFDVYYLTSATGTITVTASGGTPVVQNTSGAPGIAKLTVVAASSGTNNTVTIAATGSNVYILGIEPFLSTTSTVRKGNVGVSGATSTQCAADGVGAAFGSPASIEAYAPDLTVISLGINDAGMSVSASTVTANLQTIISAAQVSGDVILETMPPSSGSPYVIFEAQYVPAYYALARTNNIPLIDIYQRFGGTWNTYLMSDMLHPNEYGYWDWGNAFNVFLNSIIGD